MTGTLRAVVRQLSLELDSPPTVEEIAQSMRDLDRALGTVSPPPVEIRTRRNRSTLGSLRLGLDKTAVWRFTVDHSLLERDPRGALNLGLLLLHRARRHRPPRELGLALMDLRARWGERQPGRRPRGMLVDPQLEARLAEVAGRAFPGVPAEQLPSVVWAPSRSRRILGRYDGRARRIELHGALRHPGVPTVVLDNLLHHELLHAMLGPRQQGDRLVHHHSGFRAQERAFPGYHEAEAWERRHWARWVSRHSD